MHATGQNIICARSIPRTRKSVFPEPLALALLNYPAQPTNQAGWADGVMPGADNSDQDKPASHQNDLTPAKEIKKQKGRADDSGR